MATIRIYLVITVMTFMSLGLSLKSQAHPFRSLYGDEARFKVWRNEKPVGDYTLKFHGGEDDWRVMIDMNMDFTILKLFRYQYRYQAEEAWLKKKLQSLQVRINADDKHKRFSYKTAAEILEKVQQEAGLTKNPDGQLLTTHHFNSAILNHTQALNTLNGNISVFSISAPIKERIKVGDHTIEASRYQYSGDIRAEAWYDKDGRWLKLSFKDQAGGRVEFICQVCGLGDSYGSDRELPYEQY